MPPPMGRCPQEAMTPHPTSRHRPGNLVSGQTQRLELAGVESTDYLLRKKVYDCALKQVVFDTAHHWCRVMYMQRASKTVNSLVLIVCVSNRAESGAGDERIGATNSPYPPSFRTNLEPALLQRNRLPARSIWDNNQCTMRQPSPPSAPTQKLKTDISLTFYFHRAVVRFITKNVDSLLSFNQNSS